MPLSQLLKGSPGEVQAELQLILNAIVEGLCGVDAQGKATFCNEALLRMTGYTRDEIIGEDLHDLLHHNRQDQIPHSAEECPLCLGLASHQRIHDVGEYLWRKDGTCFPAEYWAHPLRQPANRTSYVVTIEDITERERAREVLHQSEEKFRRILASVPDVAWTADRDRRMVYISPKVDAVLGYTKQELCADGAPPPIIHSDDMERVNRGYAALFEHQNAFDEEYRIQRKDGSWIWVHDRATCVHHENGTLYAHGAFSDITARKQAEAELQGKTAFLEALANSTIEGILVVDGNGHMLLHNRRFAELFEMTPEILSSNNERRMLAHALKLMCNPEEVMAKVNHLNQHRWETSCDEIELRDGMVVDRYSAPVVNRKGEYYGRIWSFRDITERKRNEDTLRQLSVAVNQSPASVVIADPEGNISYVNLRFTESTGYQPEEVLGKNPRILNAGITPPEVYRELWAAISHGREWRGEFCNKKKSGELYWEQATIRPITDSTGALTHYLALKEDITERRVLESQLRQAQKLEGIGQLAAGIAHEINTPTQFVADNLTFLRDSWKSAYELLQLYRSSLRDSAGALPAGVADALDEAETKCDLEFIAAEVPRAIDQSLDGSRRVAKIVRAMKEFSHPDSADKTAADLNKAIESTITVARNEWKYVAEIQTDFDETLPPVVCYPGDINQVILNLVVNAAHAIKEHVKNNEKGRITIRTRMRGDIAEISVSDTGTGIPEAIHTRVFDPFFTTKEVGRGTGQGLSLAHTVVVKKHSGKIWFETEIGRGTTFFIHLPIKPDQPAKETSCPSDCSSSTTNP